MPVYLYNNQLLVRSEATGSKLATEATCCCTCVDVNCTGSCSVCCEQNGVTQCRTVSATLTTSRSSVTEELQSTVTFSVANISCIPVGSTVTVGVQGGATGNCVAASWPSDFNTSVYSQSSAPRTVKADRTLDSFTVQVGDDTNPEPCETFRFYLRYRTPKGTDCLLFSPYVTIGASDSTYVCCSFGGSCSTTTGTACSGTLYSTYTRCSDVSGCGTNMCRIGVCCRGGTCNQNIRCVDCRTIYGGTFYYLNNPNCNIGACCVGTSCVANSNFCDCVARVGTFYEGQTCALGACCISGVCTTRNQCDCLGRGGTFYPNNSCSSSNPCVTCTSQSTSVSNVGSSGNPFNNTQCYYTYHGTTSFTRGSAAWPSGCNCVTISGYVDDVLAVNGSPVRTVCGSLAGNVNYTFAPGGNSFSISAIDTVGGDAGLNVTVTIFYSATCGQQNFTAAPLAITAADGLTADSPPPPEPEPPGHGPGTELKALLSKVGITSTPTCSCNARANHMDIQGIQWCRDNEELILAWLKEEAEKRNLPFIAFGAKMLIRRAVKNAEKKAKKAADQPPPDTNG